MYHVYANMLFSTCLEMCERMREKIHVHTIHMNCNTLQVIRQAEQHLEEVTKKRSLYKTAIDTAKESIRQFFTEDGVFSPP